MSSSIQGLASLGSPALARAMSQDPLAGETTPVSEMARSWTPLIESVDSQADCPRTLQSDASMACRGITDGNSWSVVRALLPAYGDESPNPSQQQAVGMSGGVSSSPVGGLCEAAPNAEVNSTKVSSKLNCQGAKQSRSS